MKTESYTSGKQSRKCRPGGCHRYGSGSDLQERKTLAQWSGSRDRDLDQEGTTHDYLAETRDAELQDRDRCYLG